MKGKKNKFGHSQDCQENTEAHTHTHTNLFITDDRALWDALINAYQIKLQWGYPFLHYGLQHQHGAVYPGVFCLQQEPSQG